MPHVTITDQNFEEEVKNFKGVVLVDFWAPWCMPCQMLGPIIEELSEEMGEKVKIGKLNVDESGKTAQAFNVMSIPNVTIFKDGEVVETLVGVKPKAAYLEVLKKYIG